MSLAAEVLDAMLMAGCTAEQIVAAVKADASIEEQRRAEKRAKDAERQRKCRSKGHASSRDVTVTPSDGSDPPNDIYSNPPVSPSLANANDRPPPFSDRFVEAWNRQPLRQARKLTGQRLTKLKRRTGEFGEDGMLEAVRKLGASPFHCGKNDREWIADIGWLIRNEDNVTKALELPDPGEASKPMSEADRAAAAARTAEIYRKLGRDEDADELERKAARLRQGSGPARPIGELVRKAANG